MQFSMTGKEKASAIANILAMQIPPHLQKSIRNSEYPSHTDTTTHHKNNTEVIFTTLQTHAMITISSENVFSPDTSIATRLSSRVSISET